MSAVLRHFPDVALDLARSEKRLAVTRGGAAPVSLSLARRGKDVVVRVASPEHLDLASEWAGALPLPALLVEVTHSATRALVATATAAPLGDDPDTLGGPPGTLGAVVPLVEGVTYTFSIAATEATRPAAETLPIYRTTDHVQLLVERTKASLHLTWEAAALRTGHWAGSLPLLLPLRYEVHHAPTGARVLEATLEPPGATAAALAGITAHTARLDAAESVLSARGLYVGEPYVLRVLPGHATLPSELTFTLGPELAGAPNVARLALNRATAPLTVAFAHDHESSNFGWASELPLPPSIAYSIRHAASGKTVASGHADEHGRAVAPGVEALYVGEEYELLVADTGAVNASTTRFACVVGGNALTVPLSRVGRALTAHLKWAQAGTGHWASALPPPRNAALRVVHQGTGTVSAECWTDDQGRADLSQEAGLFPGEVYRLEAVSSSTVRASSVEFSVSASQGQIIELVVERPTSDVTIALRLRVDPGANALAAAVGVPKGMRYRVVHAATRKEVTSGTTDAVGKAVLKRPGTLFVGETYEVFVQGGKGMQQSSSTFTVSPHHREIEISVGRGFGDVSVSFRSALLGASHWGAALPLPAPVRYEIRRPDADDQVLYAGSAGAALTDSAAPSSITDTVHGEDAGLFVGETYVLHVPESEHYAAATAEFDLREGANAHVELALMRQLSACTLRLESAHATAGAGHWAAALPLPHNISFRLVHSTLGCLVASGSTGADGRCVLDAGVKRQRSAAEELAAAALVPTDIREAFASVDADASGSLSVAEVKVALKACGIVADSEEALAAIKRHDTDGGRSLDLHEFTELVEELTAHSEGRAFVPKRPRENGAALRSGVLVGETYLIKLDDDVRLAAHDQRPFVVASRRATSTIVVHRACGQIEVVCRNAKAGTAHWASELALPSVAFNVWHRGLELAVASGTAGEDAGSVISTVDALLSDSPRNRVPREQGVLFVGESYVIEVPAAPEVRPTAVEFKVAPLPAGAFQKVVVMVERATGQVVVHLASADEALPIPPGVRLNLVHKASGAAVVPPVTLAGDRTELFGEDALLVNETYLLSALPSPGMALSSTEFTVLAQPVRVELLLHRAAADVSVVFRSAPPRGNP